ncbi:hypothetical protein DLAC_04942 [Tieghemostelium lacteum]|uniref:Uncharacterized protein n=1 Tax=Tieghemostelium lacteum TaxID=361077 RepID=A0A151ZHU4_TIELA|nr:hypothetical protein DLAC_04942 [Tieghemostelium lacteum]|eukprot:KYQ93571.1 hypothetical protein DLAC_04942 [Tieghemostelium lacteum]
MAITSVFQAPPKIPVNSIPTGRTYRITGDLKKHLTEDFLNNLGDFFNGKPIITRTNVTSIEVEYEDFKGESFDNLVYVTTYTFQPNTFKISLDLTTYEKYEFNEDY